VVLFVSCGLLLLEVVLSNIYGMTIVSGLLKTVVSLGSIDSDFVRGVGVSACC
jgi:hypothetical protein